MGETRDQPGGLRLAVAPIQAAGERTRSRWGPVIPLLVYLAVVFLGGALLAPWLYQLVHLAAPSSHLAREPFHRYLDRSLLGLALIGLWPFLRSLGFDSPFKPLRAVAPGAWRRLGRGLVLGFATVACVAVTCLAVQARRFGIPGGAGHLFAKLAGSAATAAVVAVLEELLYRGAAFGALRRAWDWRLALLVSSALYAVLHFITKADLPGPVTWQSGLELLRQMFAPVMNPQEAIPALLSYTMAGIILGLAYQRTGDLYFSVGLHAGWVFWLKLYGDLTAALPTTSPSVWGTEKMVDGWLGLLVLAAAWLVLPWLAPRERVSQPA